MPQDPPPEVAIIGIGARAPDSPDLDVLWRNVVEGRECITFFDEHELEANHDLVGDPNFVLAAGLLGDIDQFDAEFFGLAPRDAELTDPQHRLFLECAWEAFENAGYDVSAVPRRVSVYGGQGSTSAYMPGDRLGAALGSSLPECERIYLPFSNHLTARVSHALGLTGESLEIRAACATGLVALNMGCRSLLAGDADLSLVGSAHVFIPERTGYVSGATASRFSPDGHCRTFDRRARGLVHTSAVGVLLLKRLDEALADRDPIHAVVKSVAVNNDGASRSTYVTPGLDLQAECVAEAQVMADAHAETITYVEAHGIAVPLADAIEVEAMRRAFAAQTSQKGFCALGSVKANLGHSGASAGAMGLIKTALALKHGVIPPQINFDEPHPNLNLDDGPFVIHREAAPWNPRCGVRRAGVHSFGMGGTNAHAVLEGPPATSSEEDPAEQRLIVLSARNPAALDAMRQRLSSHLRRHPEQSLGDVAYTLALGRSAHAHRWAVTVGSRGELLEALRERVGATGSVRDEVGAELKNLGATWSRGRAIDWAQLFEGESRNRIPLPTYPFQRQRYWLDALDKVPPPRRSASAGRCWQA